MDEYDKWRKSSKELVVIACSFHLEMIWIDFIKLFREIYEKKIYIK